MKQQYKANPVRCEGCGRPMHKNSLIRHQRRSCAALAARDLGYIG